MNELGEKEYYHSIGINTLFNLNLNNYHTMPPYNDKTNLGFIDNTEFIKDVGEMLNPVIVNSRPTRW